MIILVALGLQFFFVSPAIETSNQANITYLKALLEQHTLLEHPERAQSAIQIDKTKVELKDIQVSAEEKKVSADLEKMRSSRIYIWLFIGGTLIVIVGKLASVAYGTKSRPIT